MAVVSGGTTLIDNGALDSAVPTGSLILLQTQTASSSATIDFTSNIDSTYDSYVFKFINIHPATDASNFTFNMSTDGGSAYNVTKTTTYFNAFNEDGFSATGVNYNTGADLAQSTAFQRLSRGIGNENDESLSGEMFLYSPASTTFVKHFMSRIDNKYYDQTGGSGKAVYSTFMAGYGNTTNAINAVQFKQSSGNIDDGIIKMYGVK